MGNKTILLADDEPDALMLLTKRLTAAGYHVITAMNGMEMLNQVKITKPDLIILDILMPVLDGMEASWRLKQDPHTANIPVIFLTALQRPSDPWTYRQLTQTHPNVVFPKPFSTIDLFEKIGELT